MWNAIEGDPYRAAEDAGALTCPPAPRQSSNVQTPQGEACTGGSGGASETQLRWILERISWLEEGLRIAHIERSEAEQRSSRLAEQMERLWEELAEERRERQVEAAEERMRRLADKAQLLESAGVLSQRATSSFDADMRLETLAEEPDEPLDDADEPVERTHLQDSATASEASDTAARCAVKHAPWHVGGARAGGSVEAPSGQVEAASMECHRMSLEAKELHLMARLEAVEGRVGSRCDALQSLVDGLQKLPQEAKSMVDQCGAALRAEWRAELEEEQRRGAERAQALGRVLGEELEQSLVSQALAEVRTEAIKSARSELGTFRQQVGQELEKLHAGISKMKVEPPATADPPATKMLHQFGSSIVTLESTISGLLRITTESRDEMKSVEAALRKDFGELGRRLDSIEASSDMTKLQHLTQGVLAALKERAPGSASSCEAPPTPAEGPEAHRSGAASPSGRSPSPSVRAAQPWLLHRVASLPVLSAAPSFAPSACPSPPARSPVGSHQPAIIAAGSHVPQQAASERPASPVWRTRAAAAKTPTAPAVQGAAALASASRVHRSVSVPTLQGAVSTGVAGALATGTVSTSSAGAVATCTSVRVNPPNPPMATIAQPSHVAGAVSRRASPGKAPSPQASLTLRTREMHGTGGAAMAAAARPRLASSTQRTRPA